MSSESDSPSLADRLKELRQAAGFTSQKAFAQAVKVSQVFVHQLESGKRASTSPAVAKRMADALGVPVTSLTDLMGTTSEAAQVGRHLIPLIGVVSAGDGADERYTDHRMISISGLFPLGTVAYLVRGDSMTDANIVDGDYILVRPQPQAERGEIVVVYVPDCGTVVKLKQKNHYVSLNNAKPRNPIACDGCHEYGVLVGVIRKC